MRSLPLAAPIGSRLLKWLQKERPAPVPAPPRTRHWDLDARHTTTERARILAEIAFADFANDRGGMTERAAFRIAEALEKYDALDAINEGTKP